MTHFDPASLLNTGAFGVLAYIIWFACNRLIKAIDNNAKASESLARAVANLILKHKYPNVDVREEGEAILRDLDERKKE